MLCDIPKTFQTSSSSSPSSLPYCPYSQSIYDDEKGEEFHVPAYEPYGAVETSLQVSVVDRQRHHFSKDLALEVDLVSLKAVY